MHIKRTLQLTALSATMMLATSTYAWTGHFLAGVSGGYGSQHGDMEINSRVFGAPGRTLLDSGFRTQHISENGFVADAFLGYQLFCNQYLVGLEGTVEWQDFSETRPFHLLANNAPNTTQNTANYEHEKGTAFSLSLRGGYKIYDWLMPYVRLGAQTSRDTLTLNVTFDPSIGNNVTNAEDRKRIYRFLGGAGLEFFVMPQLSLRTEYQYTSKGDQISASGSSVDLIPLGSSPTFEHVGRTKQDQHAIKGSIVWNFI